MLRIFPRIYLASALFAFVFIVTLVLLGLRTRALIPACAGASAAATVVTIVSGFVHTEQAYQNATRAAVAAFAVPGNIMLALFGIWEDSLSLALLGFIGTCVTVFLTMLYFARQVKLEKNFPYMAHLVSIVPFFGLLWGWKYRDA